MNLDCGINTFAVGNTLRIDGILAIQSIDSFSSSLLSQVHRELIRNFHQYVAIFQRVS